MRFGIYTPNFGEFADPGAMSELAREAEGAGWDGFFVWDHLFWKWPDNQPVADPWVLLTAIATATERIMLGPLITPLPRRRPQTVARQAVSLDHLSGGRLILGVGLGGDWFGDYSTFGETADQKAHGEMLDEALEVLTKAWSGEEFSFEGRHYTVKKAQFLPRPVQEPRIPIWVAGVWPHKKPFRRAARWDGVFPGVKENDEDMGPDDHRAMLEYIREHRVSSEPFEVVHGGNTSGEEPERSTNPETLAAYADAGVTWWLEFFWSDTKLEAVRKRIRQGPPKV